MPVDLTVELTAPNGKQYTQPVGLFINNTWFKSSDEGKFCSINPADEQVITSVYAATGEDVDSAVKAARAALQASTWKDISGTARGKLLTHLASLVEENRETLATIESWDNGKAYSASLEDVTEVSETLRYYAGFADKIFGQVIETTWNKLAYTLRQPVGVCGQIIPITLETGGKSPLIVFDDADLDLAVEWAFLGIMSNQGQICTATSRIILQEAIHDSFITAFIARVKKSKIGSPFDETTFQGPQVSRAQLNQIKAYISIGKYEGAKLEFGGDPVDINDGTGFFIQPTLFSGVTADMRIFQEEVFGPFVSLSRFSTEEDALKLANGTQYGLGSAVFTTDLTKAHRVAKDIEAGMVWINSSNDSDWRVPFGGVKQSGIGRELGEAGLEAYSVVKSIHLNMAAKL
ncbi:hypothetical protein ACHAQA_005010 [Verticillium albo-atrum]